MSGKEKFKVLIIIMFLLNIFISYSCNKGSDEKTELKIKKNIHVVFNMNPAIVEYKNNEKIPVFEYDPRDDIKRSLKKAGFKVINATCPRVVKVQSIIKSHSRKGYAVIIVGDEDHPEVVGLLGYAGEQGQVLPSLEALAAAFEPEALEDTAYGLYERFRPQIAPGKRGWGQKGDLDLDLIRSLAAEADT